MWCGLLCDDPLHPKAELKIINQKLKPLTSPVATGKFCWALCPQTNLKAPKLKYETLLYNSEEFLSLLECHDQATNETIPDWRLSLSGNGFALNIKLSTYKPEHKYKPSA